MTVEHIPVFLNLGDHTPIGFGKIVDDELVITVRSEELVGRIEHLAQAGDIKELYLGFGFPVHPSISIQIRDPKRVSAMNRNGYSNSEIANALGLSENDVRIILAD